MSVSWDVRRRAEGGIDFEFYRRRADRRHRVARRLAFRKALVLIHRIKHTFRTCAQILSTADSILSRHTNKKQL